METDLTKLMAEELYNLVHDFPRSLESDNAWPEIRHRLERLEQCEAELLEARAFQELRLMEADRCKERLEILEPLYAASESLRKQMNDEAVRNLAVFNQVRERLEKCEAALRKLALDLGPLGKIARAAVEGE